MESLLSSNRKWRQELKTGDKVIIVSRHNKYIASVQRFTKTQIIVGAKIRERDIQWKFRRADGTEVSSDIWSSAHLSEWSVQKESEIREEKTRQIIINKIKSKTSWTKIKTENLIKIHDIINHDLAF